MAVTRQGTNTSHGAADVEEQTTSAQEQTSPATSGRERFERLEAQIAELTNMVASLIAAQVRGGTTQGVPVVQPINVDDVSTGERGGPSSAQDTEVQRRPGKEILRENPENSVMHGGDMSWHGMAPIKIDAKVDLPVYDGVVDGEKLGAWIDQLESYFAIYAYDDARRLAIARLKLSSHALVWWNAYLRAKGSNGLSWGLRHC